MLGASSTSRSTLFAFVCAALAFFCLSASVANAQETTLTQEDNGQVITTSIKPTVYTTGDQVLTWTPSTPPTPTPTFSAGRILKVAEYITTQSTGASGMAATGGASLPSARSCVQLGAAALALAVGMSGGVWIAL